MTEVDITLNEPHKSQEEILTTAKRFNVLACGRRFGKSALAVNLLSETVLAGDPAGYFTPTYKLLDGTYNECLHALEPIVKRKNEHQFIELITGGRIEFWSLENELAGRSRKYKRVILDEAAFTKDLWRRWTESIRATLSDLKGDGWFMSTPKGKNDFYKLFMRGKDPMEANWASWQMSTYNNPFIDPLEIDDAKADLPESAFNQEYLAQFLDNTANPFGTTFISQCTYPLSNEPAVCFGIDLAKSFDFTVIIGLDKNGQVCYFDRFQKDWRQTTQTILNLPNVPLVIDSTGVGDPIAEDIARVRDAELFQFTPRSKQQLMEGLAKAIQERKIAFPEGQITDELSNFEYQFTRTGVKYSAPAGLHDDCVCSLALAWHKWQNARHTGEISVW
jgi:hypothetical protein